MEEPSRHAPKRVVNKMDKGKGGSSRADAEGFVEVKKKKPCGNDNSFLSNSFEALNVENLISEEVETDNKASTSGVEEEGQSSTPLVETFSMFERQLLEGECVLVDDDGKLLKRLIIRVIRIVRMTLNLLIMKWQVIWLQNHQDEIKDENEAPCFSTSCNTLSSSRTFTTTTLSCTLEKIASGKFTLYYAHDENINNISTSSSSSSSHDFIDLDDDDDIKVPPAAAAGKRRLNIGSCSINNCNFWSSSNQVKQWDLATLKMKTIDLGWYTHQDLARLESNVVRLWNQIRSS
nr:hypothetical protein CTI12_AA189370 [Tanacetum cinerariifolium]